MKRSKKAFTLVELVIVVVILSILATVGFISYEDYLTDTRDSKRLAQLSGLRDAMRLNITKGKLPLPDEGVEIRNNGNIFLYQGYAGKTVLESISLDDNTMDPFDDVYYTYLLSKNRKDFQLMGFLEKYNQDVISYNNQAFANVDYSQRFPNVFGKKLGILLEQETNTPLQEMPGYQISGYIDLRDITTNQFDAYITDTYLISGKEKELIGIIPYTTCKKILENGGSYGNGIYNINPSGLNPFEVYCDMTMDSGGWTLVARSVLGSNESNFGWLSANGTPRSNDIAYSMGIKIQDINFSQMMLTTYTSAKNIESAVRFEAKDDFLAYPWYVSPANSCILIYNTSPIVPFNDPCTVNYSALGWFGHAANPGVYYFYRHEPAEGVQNPPFAVSADPNLPRYGAYGFHSSGYLYRDINSEFVGHFEGKQGMIFVR